jgi:hypothetical protein
MIAFPTDFEALAREPSKPGGGAPLQISASDLMANFNHAALDADETWVEATSGTGGHAGRKIKLPPLPGPGTFVLGCVDDVPTWLETEDC